MPQLFRTLVFGAVTSALVASGACVFELGEVVDPVAVGGAGGVGMGVGGDGGSGATGGGTAGAQRTRIDVDTSTLTGSHVDFPLLVTLEPSHVDYASAGTDGSDIRFYAEDGTTLLAHEVERWVPGGTSHVWVKLPFVDPGAKLVWLHVAEASPPAASDPSEVWSAYTAVYHLGSPNDASVGARHGSLVGLSDTDVVEGRFGTAYTFDGVNGAASPHIAFGDDATFEVPPGGALTAEVWFQRSATLDNNGYMLSLEGCCLGWGMTFVEAPLQLRTLVGVGNCCLGAGAYAYAQPAIPDDQAWHYAVAVMDRGAGLSSAYFDGSLGETANIVNSGTGSQGLFHIGSNFGGDDGFDGVLDEVRFSARALPADWIAFSHATMTGSAVTVGTPEDL